VSKPDTLKRQLGFRPGVQQWPAPIEKRQLDILQRTQSRYQIEVLEHQSYALVAELGNLDTSEREDVCAIE
jgi:hypothetical protein